MYAEQSGLFARLRAIEDALFEHRNFTLTLLEDYFGASALRQAIAERDEIDGEIAKSLPAKMPSLPQPSSPDLQMDDTDMHAARLDPRPPAPPPHPSLPRGTQTSTWPQGDAEGWVLSTCGRRGASPAG